MDPSKAHAYYSTSGSYVELSAPGGSERGFDRYGFVWQQTFDYRFTDTFLLPPELYSAPRFDVLAYVGYIGTSMATPHVAGVAAMLMQQGITNPAAIEDALEKSAVDLGAPGRDDLFGFGLVDARAALRGLGLATMRIGALLLLGSLSPRRAAAEDRSAGDLRFVPFVLVRRTVVCGG